MNYNRTSSLCAELGPLHNAYPAAGPLFQPLDDVGSDITDACKMALGFPQPWPTPEGFSLPSPGSPASFFRFEVKELAHFLGSVGVSQTQHSEEAIHDGEQVVHADEQSVHGEERGNR
jgi:hypothetical protein